MADDPTARALYRDHDSGRGRYRQDIRLHVSATSINCCAGERTIPNRKIGGLVLEVKGDFCGQVRTILKEAGRESDYTEIGLDSGLCYNPLHNDLDPYAVAYAIATLVNNLFGRSKEPFWQQAYTDLLKFVILLRRITDGYTTFSEIYRYILDDAQIERDIQQLKATLSEAPEVLLVPRAEHSAALHQCTMEALVCGRSRSNGAPLRGRSGVVSVGTRCSVRGAPRARLGLGRSSAPARSGGALGTLRMESSGRPPSVFYNGRCRRLPFAVR